uniref:DUF659 domain-containing protein n=1 Tax=Amphimedon queenslandica TaxID=400682 RepID=A0A1X7T065_AMPQE
SVSPYQRVKEFPNENLTVSGGKLFCNGCREELGLKATVVKLHVKSNKHKLGKEKLQGRNKEEIDIAQAFDTYNQKEHLAGETLSNDLQVYRTKVVKTFLKAGVPLNKVDLFRDILEEHGLQLAGRRVLSDLVPFICKQEVIKISQEIEEREVSVIFNGTTRIGEALVIILRFIGDDWEVTHRLICMQLLAKSLTGEEIARELKSVLQADYHVGSKALVGSMHDRASVNNVAMSTIKVLYPEVFNVGCFSHTIDHVGEKFKTPTLDEFVTAWITLFSHSPKAKLAWRTQTGKAVKTFSKTRWWSRWEVVNQLLELHGDILPFLHTHSDQGQATRSKMLSILQDPTKNILLQLEMAVVVDAGKQFLQATYDLEGHGTLVLQCYELIEAIFNFIRVRHFPNTDAIIHKYCTGQPSHIPTQWKQYAISCVQPGFDYFSSKFHGELGETLAAFKAARLFSPHKIVEIQPEASNIDSLKSFPFLQNDDLLSSMKSELPLYLSVAADVSTCVNPLVWWT